MKLLIPNFETGDTLLGPKEVGYVDQELIALSSRNAAVDEKQT
jgi:hypothetical protein